jgi:hypothetical protein
VHDVVPSGHNPEVRAHRLLVSTPADHSAGIGRVTVDGVLSARPSVDRLTFDASIIETGTESFRLRTTKRRLSPEREDYLRT